MPDVIEQTERTIARQVKENCLILTLRETDEFCLYNGGYFHRGKEPATLIRGYIDDVAREIILPSGNNSVKPYNLTPGKKATILEMIKSTSFVSLDDFDTKDDRVCVRNGHLWVDKYPDDHIDGLNSNDGWVYIPHFDYNESPYRTFIQIPVDYDPKAECLVIDQFLSDVFGFESVPLIYEMLAYFLMPHVKYQKAFILYGEPSTGKTTFYDMISKFYNKLKYFSELRLHELEIQFEMQNLMHKMVNYFDDLPNNKIGDTEAFRRVVTNNYLSSSIKFVNGKVDWRNRTKLVFSCNTLPPVKKTEGDAFFRRWILIMCSTIFKDADIMSQEDIDDPLVMEKDYDILDKITTDEEFSGLLNKILEAWLRLKGRGSFPKEWKNTEYIKGLWMMDINPIKLFVDECCFIAPDETEDYNLFYHALNRFRKEHKAKPVTKHACTSWLTRIDGIEKKRKGGGAYYYSGISIKDDDLDKYSSGRIDLDKILVGQEVILDKFVVKEEEEW